MSYENEMTIKFKSTPENEAFARTSTSVFISPLNPTLSELNDIKTAVSEAVTNAIIHGYEGKEDKIVSIEAETSGKEVTMSIIDKGVGIKNIEEAKEPLYTSRPDLERSGMGFTVMETFMDSMVVESEEGKGTIVTLKKKFAE